jgi:hypothetical protein
MIIGHLCPFGQHGRIKLVLHSGEREGESQFVSENEHPSKHAIKISKEGHAVLAVVGIVSIPHPTPLQDN